MIPGVLFRPQTKAEALTSGFEECRSLTDEMFKEYQGKDRRTTQIASGFFKAIWKAVNFFS